MKKKILMMLLWIIISVILLSSCYPEATVSGNGSIDLFFDSRNDNFKNRIDFYLAYCEKLNFYSCEENATIKVKNSDDENYDIIITIKDINIFDDESYIGDLKAFKRELVLLSLDGNKIKSSTILETEKYIVFYYDCTNSLIYKAYQETNEEFYNSKTENTNFSTKSQESTMRFIINLPSSVKYYFGDVEVNNLDSKIITVTYEDEFAVVYEKSISENHVHEFSEKWMANSLTHWQKCSCGSISKESNHNYGSWVIVKEATYVEKGVKKRNCIVCNYEQQEEIPELVHIHTYSDSWSSNDKYHWHASICGHINEIKDRDLHNYGKWIVEKESTTYEKGVRKKFCTICNYIQYEEIPKLHAHEYSSNWKYNNINHWYECSCGNKIDEEEHIFGEWIVIKNSTERNDGLQERTCSKCNYKQQKVLESQITFNDILNRFKKDWVYSLLAIIFIITQLILLVLNITSGSSVGTRVFSGFCTLESILPIISKLFIILEIIPGTFAQSLDRIFLAISLILTPIHIYIFIKESKRNRRSYI